MTVRITESRIPAGYLPSELGQVDQRTGSGGAKYILVAFLTSPVRKGTEQQYVVFVIDAAAEEYRWRIEPSTGPPARDETTEIGVFTHIYRSTGLHTVEVQVVEGGSVVATLELSQFIREPDSNLEGIYAAQDAASVTGWAADERTRDVRRELWNDFNLYIEAAADATGANGVPVRLVAAILNRECWGRPKRGSSGAADLIAADDIGHIREVEIDLLAKEYEVGRPGLGRGPSPPLPTTIGAGQFYLPTLAALENLITWREGAAAGITGSSLDRKFVTYLNSVDFINLPFFEQIDCFNLARFPKTNITLVARLLAKLKNRPHRWPSVARDDVLDTEKLVEIVATEYNMGPTGTPAAAAEPNMYGESHIKLMVAEPLPDDFVLFQ